MAFNLINLAKYECAVAAIRPASLEDDWAIEIAATQNLVRRRGLKNNGGI